MGRTCDICGRGTSFGKTIQRRGLPKKQGGIGLKTTGITRRTFKINLQQVRVKKGGGTKRMRVCTRCIRSGKIQKAG